MTIITITQSLFHSLKRTTKFVKKCPEDCQISIILATQILESFFNELAIIDNFMEKEYRTAQIESLCNNLLELEKSKKSLKQKVIETNNLLHGKNEFKKSQLYENLVLLIALRNRLIHPRPIRINYPGTLEEDKLFKKFKDKSLIDFYDEKDTFKRSPLYYLKNIKVAEWCISTVKNIILYYIDLLPNEEAKIAMGIVKISVLEPDELEQYIDENKS